MSRNKIFEVCCGIIAIVYLVLGLLLLGDGGAVSVPLTFMALAVIFALLSYRFDKLAQAEAGQGTEQGSAQGSAQASGLGNSSNRTGSSNGTQATFKSSFFEDTKRYLVNSQDPMSSLLDLEEHAETRDAMLAELLGRAHAQIADLQSHARSIEGIRFLQNNNNCWWIAADFDNEDIPFEEANVLLDEAFGVEAALNVWGSICQNGPSKSNSLQSEIDACFARVAELGNVAKPTPNLEFYIKDVPLDGEWGYRVQLADYLESLPAPFRVKYEFRVNVKQGFACINLFIPSARCFGIFFDELGLNTAGSFAHYTPSKTCIEQQIYYAYRLSLAVAQGSFNISSLVSSLAINCYEYSADAPFLAFQLTLNLLGSARAIAGPELNISDIAEAPYCSLGFDEQLYTTEEVVPFATFDSPKLQGNKYSGDIELDTSIASPRLQEACGAQLICDLGINENCARVSAFSALVKGLSDNASIQEFVSELVKLRESTPYTSCHALALGFVITQKLTIVFTQCIKLGKLLLTVVVPRIFGFHINSSFEPLITNS